MEKLTPKEYKMIRLYKKTKDVNIPLYFFNKYHDDLTKLIFYKINKNFSSVPFEKGDLFYFVWNGIKTTLEKYKKKQNFNVVLVNNCYSTTIKEVKKFLKNGELIMNMSSSFEQYQQTPHRKFDRDGVSYINSDNKLLLNNLISEACECIKKYKQETIENVIYLKSMGFNIKEISERLNVTVYYVNDLLNLVEKIVRGKNQL